MLAVYLPAATAAGVWGGRAGVADCSTQAASACFFGSIAPRHQPVHAGDGGPALMGAMLGMAAQDGGPPDGGRGVCLCLAAGPRPVVLVAVFLPGRVDRGDIVVFGARLFAMDIGKLPSTYPTRRNFVIPFVTIHLPKVFGFQITRFMVLELGSSARWQCWRCSFPTPAA